MDCLDGPEVVLEGEGEVVAIVFVALSLSGMDGGYTLSYISQQELNMAAVTSEKSS